MKKFRELFEIFFVFLRLGFVSFGGGLAIFKIYTDELVKKKNYLTEEELLNFYAISQTIPGIIIVNVALFIGNKKGGFLGMLAAMLGVITPSIIIISIIAANLKQFAQYKITHAIFKGINMSICSVITIMSYDIIKKNLTNVLGWIIAIGAFIALFFLNIPIYIVVLATIIVSLLWMDCEGE